MCRIKRSLSTVGCQYWPSAWKKPVGVSYLCSLHPIVVVDIDVVDEAESSEQKLFVLNESGVE